MTDVVLDMVGPAGRTALVAAKRAEDARDAALAAVSTIRADTRTVLGAGALATGKGIGVTAIGEGSLALNTGDHNTSLGHQSLRSNVSGAYNVGFGSFSLASVVAGTGHVGIGYNAGASVRGGTASVFIGFGAGNGPDQIQNPEQCIAIGYNAVCTSNLQTVIGGPDVSETALRGRVRIGPGGPQIAWFDAVHQNYWFADAGSAASVGDGNLAIGLNAMSAATTALACVAVGKDALASCTTGNDHTAIGSGAMQHQESGIGCTALGREAGFMSVKGTNWTALGDTSLKNNLADLNVGVGYAAARDNTTGSVVAVGTYAAGYTKEAKRITVVGTEAFGAGFADGIGHGDDNTGVGYRIGHVMLGSRNALFGSEVLMLAGTFNDVTALGYRAGSSTTGGSKATFIGSNAGKNDNQKLNPTNVIAIGADTVITKDNQTVIGTSASDELVLHGVRFSKAKLLLLAA